MLNHIYCPNFPCEDVRHECFCVPPRILTRLDLAGINFRMCPG